jgi:hypothetical protein
MRLDLSYLKEQDLAIFPNSKKSRKMSPKSFE